MNRRRFLADLGALSLGAAAVAPTRSAAAQERRKPNLVIILADDLGYGDLGCYGNPDMKTPHLDRLAAEGVRFTDFHSSGAVSSPTRAGLLTGRYQQRAGVGHVITARRHRDMGLPLREVTFAEALKGAGYATACFGKWHLGYLPKFNPVRQGFDRFVGYVSGNVDYLSHIDQTGVADWWHGDRLQPEEGYTTHLITQHSLDFIERHKDTPFCLYIAHEAPHYPYQGPEDTADRTVGGEFPVRGSRSDKERAYAEMIAEMDESVGQVIATLTRLGLERETFVFFFSDNGATRLGSNGPLRGHKGQLWEGGHRVPAIAWWPRRISAGEECHEPAICLDLFPTLLALGNGEAPRDRPLDGADLSPALFQGKGLDERTLFWAYRDRRAVRRGQWKLVLGEGKHRRKPGLYNLDDDLAEQNDLAEKHPERVEELHTALRSWQRSIAASQRSLGKRR